jgi:putative hemolysin
MFRRGLKYTPKGSSNTESLGLLAVSLLFLLTIISVFLLIYLRRRKRNVQKRKTEKTQQAELQQQQIELDKHKENMYIAGEKVGIYREDLEQELFGSSNLTCLVYPENGGCDANFYDLKNGCCELKNNARELNRKERDEQIRKLILTVFYAVLPEIILQSILPKLTKSPKFLAYQAKIDAKLAIAAGTDPATKAAAREAGQEAAEKAAKQGASKAAQRTAREAAEKAVTKAAQKAAQQAALKGFSKTMSKVIGKVAARMVVQFARRMAQIMMKILVKLSSGPVGWALLIFDAFVIIQDTADVYNYNSFIDNKINMNSRDQLIYVYNKAIKLDGGDFPVLFPFSLLFQEESEGVTVQYMSHIFMEHMDILLEVDGGTEYLVDMLFSGLEAEIDGVEPPPLSLEEEQKADKIVEDFFDKAREKHHRALDVKYFELLQAAVPANRRSDIVLVQSMSSKETIGISISEAAANKWNVKQKADWFKYHDPFFPPNRPTADWTPAMAAAYTDTYLTPNMSNPGTENQPNIVTKSLPQKVVLAYPFGPLVTFCEKPRTSAKYKKPIDPTKYGVSFDIKTGVCNYTRDYCKRYGIDFKRRTWRDGTPYNECELDDTQEVFEFIFGQENVRLMKTWFTDPEMGAEMTWQNTQDTYNRREDEYGTGGAIALTVLDPTGMYEGFGQNIAEQLGGRDKYCDPADTCKRFHVKHTGGNFMTMTARDKNGDVYSNGQGFQNQVKDGEDHTFFVPEGGYFKADCNPGSSDIVQYNDIGNPLKCSCWYGKARCGDDGDFWSTTWDGIVDAAETVGEAVGDAAETVGEEIGGAAETVGGGISSGAGAVGGGISSVFSDRRLKQNIHKMRVASPIPGLSLYTWEWNEIAMSNYGLKGRDFGFIADEIDDQYISKDVYGYEFIREDSPIYQALVKLKSR